MIPFKVLILALLKRSPKPCSLISKAPFLNPYHHGSLVLNPEAEPETINHKTPDFQDLH